MKLLFSQLSRPKHSKTVSCVGWTPSNELFSVADDQTIWKWTMDGEPDSKLMDLDAYVTAFQWYTAVRGTSMTADVFVIGCSDGSIRIVSNSGRVEKMDKDAHSGAVTSIAWNQDGTSLLTSGEDGAIKQWSRSGNLRSRLIAETEPIMSVVWSPDQQSILYACGSLLVLKPLAPSSKPTKWKAHEGAVLALDWNPINHLIATGGEDGRYKVWDAFGACLFSSKPTEAPITSIAWCPSGDYFAAGSFNLVTLCDRTGWAHGRSRLSSGSVLDLDWTRDGTRLCAAGSTGAVCFGHLVDRRVEWGPFEVSLTENNQLIVQDVTGESAVLEELEFSSRVIDFSMEYDHLVVTTVKSCYIYSTKNFSTPHMFDLRTSPHLILQSDRYFMLVDAIAGLTVYSYVGKVVCQPKFPNMNAQFLKQGNISMSSDTLAVIDRQNACLVHFLDVETGKKLSEPMRHDTDVAFIALSQSGMFSARKLAFLDHNHDLYLLPLHGAGAGGGAGGATGAGGGGTTGAGGGAGAGAGAGGMAGGGASGGTSGLTTAGAYKLGSMIDSVIWHDRSEMLCSGMDGRVDIWYYPNMVFVDRDLVPFSRESREIENLGKGCAMLSFSSDRVTIRRSDGALQVLSIAVSPLLLHRYSSSGEWSRCARLCRMVNDNVTWGVFAGLALSAQQLDSAELALAHLDQIEKVRSVQEIMSVPTSEGRAAALAMYRRQSDLAESILLQANLTYRAITLNLTCFRWTRALELACKYNTHIDTVLAYRQEYLKALGRDETEDKFLALKDQVPLDWTAIHAKIEQEEKREASRGTPYRSTIKHAEDFVQTYFAKQGKHIDPIKSTDAFYHSGATRLSQQQQHSQSQASANS